MEVADPPPQRAAVVALRPDLVIIPRPAGEVTIGSPSAEPGRRLDEPERPVAIAEDFALSITEVTQAQWRAVLGTRPSYFDAAHGGADDHPVERVSAFDAMAYLDALSRREGLEACYADAGCTGEPGTGCAAGEARCDGSYTCRSVEPKPGCLGYRLPTEAEWEYAARAGTSAAFYGGAIDLRGANDAPALDPFEWYGGNSGLAGGAACGDWPERQDARLDTCGTHPVALKAASPWRLADVIGNVAEWTLRVDDGLPAADVERANEWRSVLRGCSWFSLARGCRAADRIAYPPAVRLLDIGFRLARSFPRPSNP